jgi:hypothetical protein
MSGPIPAINSGLGGSPASMLAFELCMLMNRIVISPIFSVLVKVSGTEVRAAARFA